MTRIVPIIALAAALAVPAVAHAKHDPLPSKIAAAQVQTWRCQSSLDRNRTRPQHSPWALPHSPAYRRAALRTWTALLASCQAAKETFRQWAWRLWLPAVWRAIAACETQINWQHNSGTYQGAFGFYRGAWDQFKPAGYPAEAYQATPWQQYQVALAIHARYGFSGWGCYTGGGYRYHL